MESSCGCENGNPGERADEKELGYDAHYSDIVVFRCQECRQPWLRYHYENESYSRSSCVYWGAIAEEDFATVTAAGAKPPLESLPRYRFGQAGVGTGWTSGPLNLFP